MVTTYTYDATNRLTKRVVDGDDVYLYTWSDAGRLTREEWNGYTVRTFGYDGAGRLLKVTLPGFTTTFQYNGDGHRLVKAVNGDPVTYTLDYGRNAYLLVERSITSTRYYLYGERCIGEQNGGTQAWSYYLADGAGRVRQVADEAGKVELAWSYTASGEVLSGPEGYYVLLDCPGGVYDWSTGLIFLGGRYFDPTLGIWIAMGPFIVLSGPFGNRKKKRRQWMSRVLWVLIVLIVMTLAGCDKPGPTPGSTPVCMPEDKLDEWIRRDSSSRQGQIEAAIKTYSLQRYLDKPKIMPKVTYLASGVGYAATDPPTQDVTVHPSAFTGGRDPLNRAGFLGSVIGHEFQHVNQWRSPTQWQDQAKREIAAYQWELDHAHVFELTELQIKEIEETLYQWKN
jgi:YD repeat-containing protein